MLVRYFRSILSLLVVLHFAGLTQLVSAYARDKASFISMVNQSEEESKKEKESQEEIFPEWLACVKAVEQPITGSIIEGDMPAPCRSDAVNAQFIGDCLTPPPNSLI